MTEERRDMPSAIGLMAEVCCCVPEDDRLSADIVEAASWYTLTLDGSASSAP